MHPKKADHDVVLVDRRRLAQRVGLDLPRRLREEGADAVAGHAKLALESLLRSVEVSTSYFLCENACAKYTFSNFCRSVTIWTKSGDNNVDLERIRC